MTSELLSDIWSRAFKIAGTGEKCCLGCGHEVEFWVEGNRWRVRNKVFCARHPDNCLVTELRIAGNQHKITIVEQSGSNSGHK